MQPEKRKSHKRFEQLNELIDGITGTLPTPTHGMALMVCFRHGRPGGRFRVAIDRIADSAGISRRQAQRVLDDLERMGVVELLKEHQGPIPRLYRITGRRANGDTHDTIKKQAPPDLMMTPMTANSDTHDR